jgi:hypothetical protein
MAATRGVPTMRSSASASTRVKSSETLVASRADVPAPAFEPHDVVALLWGAAERLPAPPAGCVPRIVNRLVPLVARLPADTDVVRYVLELDGSRPFEDVIDFGPDEPGVIARALSVAYALGAVEAGTHADLVSIRGAQDDAGPPRPARGDASVEYALSTSTEYARPLSNLITSKGTKPLR